MNKKRTTNGSFFGITLKGFKKENLSEDIKKFKKKKKEHELKSMARKGIKRSRKLRELESDRLLVKAKADLEKEKARVRIAKRSGRGGRKRTVRKKKGSLYLI